MEWKVLIPKIIKIPTLLELHQVYNKHSGEKCECGYTNFKVITEEIAKKQFEKILYAMYIHNEIPMIDCPATIEVIMRKVFKRTTPKQFLKFANLWVREQFAPTLCLINLIKKCNVSTDKFLALRIFNKDIWQKLYYPKAIHVLKAHKKHLVIVTFHTWMTRRVKIIFNENDEVMFKDLHIQASNQ